MSSEENSTPAADVEEDSFVVIDEVTDNQTENDKGQGTELGSELLIDSAETEKEIDSFLKNESKPQDETTDDKKTVNTVEKHAPKEEKKVIKVEQKNDTRITSRYALSVGGLRPGDKKVLTQMLLKRFGKNKYIMKPTRLGDKYTYLYFRSRECMKTAEKMLNNKMISGHRITAKALEKKKVEKKTEPKDKKQVITKKVSQDDAFGGEDYNEQVKYKEKYSRHQVLSLVDTLEAYLPPLKPLISDRKKRHSGLLCKVDKLKQCAPKNGAYCKCSFLIDLDADTGKPILGRFYKDGKVRKNWKGKQFYHPSILEAADVFEQFVISSKWDVGRCNKGFWRKLHIRCNKSGELLLWILVQSPQDKSSEEMKKLKALLKEFFEKGEGKKCKISSVYTRVTYTSSSKSSARGGSVIHLTMGKEHFEDNILGFKMRINPKISTLWNMEQSSMMCDAVKDLMALDSHTSVIIIGLNDSGLLALTLANQAGEVICVDKRMPVAEAKQNATANKLASKCKFYAGFASEELRKIAPKYKKSYAVLLVPTVLEIMAFKERKNLSAVKTIVTFLECSKLNSRPMKVLADPEQGVAFFPSRIIPFDTHPNEKTFMMAVRLERVHVPAAKKLVGLTKSSNRSSRISLMRRYGQNKSRMQHRMGILLPEKRERNRMLPDAREVILARRYRKEKEQLKSRFNSYEQPNLVIEVKKPSYGNTIHGEAYAERYVKERKMEAEEYRRSLEDRALKLRAKPNIQDVLTDSLKQSLPSINDDTAEKLKQVIAEAITDAGFLASSSSHERKKRTPTPPPPRAIDHRSDPYAKYSHSSLDQRYERRTPVMRHVDDGRRSAEKQIEISRNSYRNPPRNDKRLQEEGKYDRISPGPLRISPTYVPIRRTSLERSKRYEAEKYDIDRRSNEARMNVERSYASRRDVHRSDYPKVELPPSTRRLHDSEERLHRAVEHEREMLSDSRRVEADAYKRGLRPSFDRIGTRDQRNTDRRELDLVEYEKRNTTLTRRSLEEREMPLHKRGPPQNHIYDERDALLARKRALDMESRASDHIVKRRRSQDHDPYDHREIPSIKRRTLGDAPYRSSERVPEVPHYLLKDDVSHARKMADVDRYERTLAAERISERDRELLIRREMSNTVPQVPNRPRDRDYRHTATIEKQSMLPSTSFGTLSSGSATSLDRRPPYQSLDRRLGPDTILSNSGYSLNSLQRNMTLSQPPNLDFRRPYPSFGPPR